MIALLALALADDAHAADDSVPWALVGLYDAAALPALDSTTEDWAWEADPAMTESCGAVKRPHGLGMLEAEAIYTGRTPALAMVIERRDPKTSASLLDTRNLRVALGSAEAPAELLQPAVVPRRIALTIRRSEEEGVESSVQLLRYQLARSLCLEHKVGRGWLGGEEDEVRVALQLQDPPYDRPELGFWSGQNRAVPALLGPPAACEVSAPARATPRDAGGGVELVAADIWAAALPACGERCANGADDDEDGKIDCQDTECASDLACGGLAGVPLPLSIEGQADWRAFQAQDLELELRVLPGEDPASPSAVPDSAAPGSAPTACVRVTSAGEATSTLLTPTPLNFKKEQQDRQLEDVVALVPYRYPTLPDPMGAPLDPDRYTVLLVPAWQVAQAARRLAARCGEDCTNGVDDDRDGQIDCEDPSCGVVDACGGRDPVLRSGGPRTPVDVCDALPTLSAEPGGVAGGSEQADAEDAVGWLLAHPELLHVQVPKAEVVTAAVGPCAVDGADLLPAYGEAEWHDLAAPVSGGVLGIRHWGYTTGLFSGRRPVVAVGRTAPTSGDSAEAHRASAQAAFLGAFAVLLALLLPALARISELWRAVPEERLAWWPSSNEPPTPAPPKPPAVPQ